MKADVNNMSNSMDNCSDMMRRTWLDNALHNSSYELLGLIQQIKNSAAASINLIKGLEISPEERKVFKKEWERKYLLLHLVCSELEMVQKQIESEMQLFSERE